MWPSPLPFSPSPRAGCGGRGPGGGGLFTRPALRHPGAGAQTCGVSGQLLSLVLLVLAVLGFVALVTRLGRAALRLGLSAAEKSAAGGLAEVSHRRGDVTGFLERRDAEQSLRRARRRAALGVGAYALLLAIPAFAGMAREVYAACALLWFLPRRPIRPPSLATGTRSRKRPDVRAAPPGADPLVRMDSPPEPREIRLRGLSPPTSIHT